MGGGVASGGFVARSERNTLDVSSATGDVGPGAYDLALSHESYPAPVPFLTSGEKNCMPNNTTSAMTPGVGAYDADGALDALRRKRTANVGPTANFASGPPRLAEERSAVPGPGAYEGGGAWIKKRWTGPQPAVRVSVTGLKGPTAPSIPARDQSYGYEEGTGGLLVMQKSPDPILSGRTDRAAERVGPGAYNTNEMGVVGKGGKAINWGHSKGKRGQAYETAAPGPGAYNPVAPGGARGTGPLVIAVGGVEVVLGGPSGTSTFASKVPLASQAYQPEHARTPGPGAYNASNPGASIGSKAMPLPVELQCFSSTARRSIDPTKSLSAPMCYRTPGPGAYDDPRGRASYSQSLSFGEPQPFNTSAQRFGGYDNGVPGPLDYRPEDAGSMARAAEKRAAVGKGGVFGSAAARFVGGGGGHNDGDGSGGNSATPGPASYQPKVEPSPPRHRGDAASFASKTHRFRASTAPSPATGAGAMAGSAPAPREDPSSRVGPGAYAVADPWTTKGGRHPGFKKTAFGSDSTRAPAFAGSAWTPGPGRYRQDVDMGAASKPVTMPAKDTIFGSSTARFKPNGNSSPGPGSYALNGDLLRKSYNVTYTPA